MKRPALLIIVLALLFAPAAIAPTLAQQSSAVTTQEVDLRGAIIASRKGLKEHGGFLVIWYDERNKWDAGLLFHMLKEMGTQKIIILAGRTDGNFQLIAGGRTDKNLYDLNDARSGLLGAMAINLRDQMGIK